MNLLDRHIFRSVLLTCLASVGLFTFVLMLGNVIRDLLPYVLSGQLPLLKFCRLALLIVPFVISYALPLGMLTGVLLTLGRLSADCEITAMRAAGLSIRRIARPIFLLAVLGVAAGLRVNFESLPWSRVEYHKELAAAVRANPISFIVPKTFIRNFDGYVAYVGSDDGSLLRDVWLWKLDSEKRVVWFTRADSGIVDYDQASNSFIVRLKHFTGETLDPSRPEDFTDRPLVGSSEETAEPIRLPLTKIFGTPIVQQKIQWMTYKELQAEKGRIAGLKFAPTDAKAHARDAMKVSLTVQEKINTALAVLSFALIGVPLGIRVSRRETSANLGVAVAIALGYYFLTNSVGWLDRHPEYRPDLLLWVPNIIVMITGIVLLQRIESRT